MVIDTHDVPLFGSLKAQLRSAATKFTPPDHRNSGFEKQLMAMSGKDHVNSSHAKVFNENGFFRSGVSLHNQAIAWSPSSTIPKGGEAIGSNHPVAALSELGAKPNPLITDFADNFLSISSSRYAEGASVSKTLKDSPDRKLSADVVQSDKLASSQKSNSSGAAVSAPPQSNETVKSGPEIQKASDVSKQITASKLVVDLMNRIEIRRRKSPIKLALHEIDVGLRLVAEFGSLSSADRKAIRTELLALLAQHGLGNYELLMDGDQFANRIPISEEQ